jgi:hypothetical protein
MAIITPNKPTGPTPGQKTPAQRQGPAISLGQQMFNQGSGLLGSPIAGNGFNQVQMPQGPAMPTSNVAGNSFGMGGSNYGGPFAPDKGTGYGMERMGMPTGPIAPDKGTGYGMGPRLNSTAPSNPWLQQQGQGIMNQTNQMLGQNLLGIQGNSVASGGLGGSRQGVAQGTALGQASNYLSSNLADMYGSAYENDANRNMQKYGIDTNSFVGQRGQDITMRGQDLQNYNQGMDRGLQQYQGDQNFYTSQRGQDLATAGLGSGLITQGLQTQWLPMQNASDVYAKFAGNGTTTNTSSSGGGWMGALGGAAGIYQMGNAGGWW